MPSVYDLKPRFQAALAPLLPALHRHGVTPNALTIAGILLSGAIGVAVPHAARHVAAGVAVALGLLARMGINALDGLMARTYQMESRVGKILNEGGDIVSDLLILVPLAASLAGGPLTVAAFAVGGLATELSALAVEVVRGRRPYDGPMGKSDRALLVGAYAVFATRLPPGAVHALFTLATLLTAVTVSNRVRAGAPATEVR